MQTHVTVDCPIPGLEDVTIEFDMMMTEAEMDRWVKSLGTDQANFVTVHNWPEGKGDPFGSKSSPMAFRLWACRVAFEDALTKFVGDENL